METRRFLNHSQPQMLQSATILLYINAVFSLLGGNVISLAFAIGGAAAGFGIANDKKIGYYGAIVLAILPLALTVLLLVLNGFDLSFNVIVQLMFEILLVVLLVHPMSRNYARIWFK